MFKIIQKRKIWFGISGLFILISLLALLFWGLKLGIDFTGGSLLELQFKNQPLTSEEITYELSGLNLPYLNIQPTSDNGIILKTKTLTENEHQIVLKWLSVAVIKKNENLENVNEIKDADITPKSADIQIEGEGVENLEITTIESENFELATISESAEKPIEELRFDSIGPTIGKELQQKAIYAIIIVIIAIVFYIAYAFRKVSHPVESWKYGISAVIALTHDILIITGIFAILGHFLNYQVDTLFVTALLTVLGFSVHDTIVTFDRTRENLHHHQDKTYEEVVNISVNQTIIRSLNTSTTTLFVLVAIYLFGGQTIRHFVLALMMGVLIGTYSSIFLASPLLLVWYRLKKY